MRPVTSTTWTFARRTRASASRVRGGRRASSPISVRSRSHATVSTSRGKSGGSSIRASALWLRQEVDERLEVRGRQLAVRLGHQVLEALLDVRARVDDRLVHELGEWFLRLLRVLRQLVEVGTDGALRARGGVGVTRGAAIADEESFARRLLLPR